LGFAQVITYLQSGNVVFESPATDPSRLAKRIEGGIEQALGYSVPVFIRQPKQLEQILANNPFLVEGMKDTKMLHVSFLYRPAGDTALSKLVFPEGIPDKFARGDSVIYLYYPNGYAKARISNAFLEKALGVPLTNRNWNTVNALYRMAIEI